MKNVKIKIMPLAALLLIMAATMLTLAEDLYNTSQLGQVTRKQEVYGLQVNDSFLIKGPFWYPRSASRNYLLLSDSRGFATWGQLPDTLPTQHHFTNRVTAQYFAIDTMLFTKHLTSGVVKTNTGGGVYVDTVPANWCDSIANCAWGLTGNAGTDPITNYLGTTDVDSLRFQLHGIPWGYLDNLNSSINLGSYAGDGGVSGYGIMIGYAAGQNGTGGVFNIGIGYNALNTSTGSNNVAIGFNSAFGATAENQVMLGTNSGIANTGSNVFFAGVNSGAVNSGRNVIAIGDSACKDNSMNNVIALGINAAHNNSKLENALIISDSIKTLKLSLGTDSTPCYNCKLVNDSTGIARWAKDTADYYLYIAKVWQSGTDDPQDTVIVNTFNGNFSWLRNTDGEYNLELPSAHTGTLTAEKSYYHLTPGVPGVTPTFFYAWTSGASAIMIEQVDVSGTRVDDFSELTVEFRLYK